MSYSRGKAQVPVDFTNLHLTDPEDHLAKYMSCRKAFVRLPSFFEFVGRGNGNLERRFHHNTSQSLELSNTGHRVISDDFNSTP